MIENKIFQFGATSIEVMVSVWKRDKTTPAKYKCIIKHENHSPSAVTAERDNALAAERECTEKFIEIFGKKDRRVHSAVKTSRPSDDLPDDTTQAPAPVKARIKPAAKPVVAPVSADKALPVPEEPAKAGSDSFEY